MTQISRLKLVLGNQESLSDELAQYYLDCASEIICERRNATAVEVQFLTIQIRIAVEFYNKRGAEGEYSHSENGIQRMYEKSDVSPSVLALITPMVRTPFSSVRVIE